MAISANSPASNIKLAFGIISVHLFEGLPSHFPPLHCCSQRAALHVKEHAPDRHRCLQWPTSLVHTMWQLWHSWWHVRDEHVSTLQPVFAQDWLQSLKRKLFFPPEHSQEVWLHFWKSWKLVCTEMFIWRLSAIAFATKSAVKIKMSRNILTAKEKQDKKSLRCCQTKFYRRISLIFEFYIPEA